MRRAFTLIELLVVLGIIALLVGLLLPAVQKVREAAAVTKCQNNLKQIALACHSHESVRGMLPDGGVYYYSVAPDAGWLYQILPYLEQSGIYATADPSIIIPTYCCPDRPRRVWDTPWGRRGMGDYAGNAGQDMTNDGGWGQQGDGLDAPIRRRFNGWTGTRYAEITNGLSNVTLAGEKRLNRAKLYEGQPDDDQGWYCGWDMDEVRWTRAAPESDWNDPTGQANGRLRGQFGGPHPWGMPRAKCDGSVDTVRYDIDQFVWAEQGRIR